ncbi:MAG: transposase [Oligoflexales bacterium]
MQDQEPSQILKVRLEESLPVLDRLWLQLQNHQSLVPPDSLLGKAMTYMSNQWKFLNAFTLSGQLPIHNNVCENAIRPFVGGRKNWLFSTSIKGAQASAVLYSLIETAKANKVNPQE